MKKQILSLFLILSLVIGIMVPLTALATDEQMVTVLSAKSVQWGPLAQVTSLISPAGGWWYDSAAGHPQLEFEFGVEREFTSINFMPRGDLVGMAQSFKVYASSDGINFGSAVATFENIPATLAGTKINFSSPIITKHIRVEFYDSYNNGSTIELTKVQFYAVPLAALPTYTRTPVMRKLTSDDIEIIASKDTWGTASIMLNDGSWFLAAGDRIVDLTIKKKKSIAIAKIEFIPNKNGSEVFLYPPTVTFGAGNTLDTAKTTNLVNGPNGGSAVITDGLTNGYNESTNKITYTFDEMIDAPYMNLKMDGAIDTINNPTFQVNGTAIYGYDLDEVGDMQIAPTSAKSVAWGTLPQVTSLIAPNGGYWADGYSTSSHPQLDFEFASEKDITSIVLTPRGDYVGMPTAVKVYASNDGIDFGNAIAQFENYLPIQQINTGTILGLDKPLTTKYIRLEFYNPRSSGTIELTQVKFFATPKSILTERRLTTADLEISASNDTWGTAATMINDGVWFNGGTGEAALSVDLTIKRLKNVAISKIVFTANMDGPSVQTYPTTITFGGGTTAHEAKANPLAKGPNGGSSIVTDALTNGFSSSTNTFTYTFDYSINTDYSNLRMDGASWYGYAALQINGAVIYGYDLNEVFSNYKVSADNVITKVQNGDTAAQFKSRMAGASVVATLTTVNDAPITDDNAKIGTGTKVNIVFGGETEAYTIVLYGDVDGNGLIDLSDLVSIRDDILGAEALDSTYHQAGDFYGEGDVTLNDLVGIMASLSGAGNINQDR